MRSLGLTLMIGMLAGCMSETAGEPIMEAAAGPAQGIARDAAVEYANKLAGAGSVYRQGVSGNGDDRIHYVEAGSGPTVLFVHGFPSFWYVWRDQMEALRQCRRVIAIDAIGSGLSAKPFEDENYTVENLANRLDRLISELAPDKEIVLIGHDWGGALTWSYVQSNPSRVEKLAVFSAPSYNLLLDLLATDPDQREASSYMSRLLHIDRETASSDTFKNAFFDLAYKRMVETNVLDQREGTLFRQALGREGALFAGIQWYKANIPPFEQTDVSDEYWPVVPSPAEVPVLLVRGAEDRTFVKQMETRAEAHASDLTVVTIQDVGHWTQFQKPDEANKALSGFILAEGEVCQ